MSLDTGLVELIRSTIREELQRAGLDRPKPYPIAVKVQGAAELLSTSESTVNRLVRTGRLRTLDTGGIGPRLIPTLALFELDPAVRNQMRLVVIDSADDDPADRPGDAA